MQMDKEQYGKAKACLISCMQEGHSWQVAKAQAGLQISQSNAYRLWRAFRLHGEAALSDGRHGQPSKLREAARAFLEERCQQAPQTPSSTIQSARGKKGGKGRRFFSTRVARRCWQFLDAPETAVA
jgi:transposase